MSLFKRRLLSTIAATSALTTVNAAFPVGKNAHHVHAHSAVNRSQATFPSEGQAYEGNVPIKSNVPASATRSVRAHHAEQDESTGMFPSEGNAYGGNSTVNPSQILDEIPSDPNPGEPPRKTQTQTKTASSNQGRAPGSYLSNIPSM